MRKAPPELTGIIAKAVTALGYELVGVELIARPKSGHLLRLYVDQEGGVGLSDCEKVSHQVSGALDVEDPIRGEYTLEVSSPGLDRPLFELAHFARFVGSVARVKTHAPIDGRSNYKGTIVAVESDDVILQVEDKTVRLPFANVASARLVPEILGGQRF